MDSQNKNRDLEQGGAQGAGSQPPSIGGESGAQHGGGQDGGMNTAPTQYAGQGQEQDRMQHSGDRQQGGEQQGGMRPQGGQPGGAQGADQHQGGMHQGGEQGGQQGKGGSTER